MSPSPKRLRLGTLLLAGLGGLHGAVAQAPEDTVQWSASVSPPATLKRGSTGAIHLSADVLEGWHVYALAQPPGGPTPLRITLADNPIARIAGAASGTAPEQRHDPSFDLDTRFYPHSFVLSVPITVKPQAVVGAQSIPVDVHFQSCSERTCLPPKTIRLVVPVTVLAAA